MFIKDIRIAQCGEFFKKAFGDCFCSILLVFTPLNAPRKWGVVQKKTNSDPANTMKTHFEVVVNLIFDDVFYEQSLLSTASLHSVQNSFDNSPPLFFAYMKRRVKNR